MDQKSTTDNFYRAVIIFKHKKESILNLSDFISERLPIGIRFIEVTDLTLRKDESSKE